ncbi:MAG: hypothetical protein FWH38_03140 [Treponema sp.]|nr:hypothetical protein [Treponema sp.]
MIPAKSFFIVCLFLVSGTFLWARNTEGETAETGAQDAQAPGREDREEPVKKEFRLKNRGFEISLANIGLSVSNDFLSSKDVLGIGPFGVLGNIAGIIRDPESFAGDKIVIDIDDFLQNGFKMGFGLDIKPVSFNFNFKDRWGFGLDIAHIKAAGNVSISKNAVTLAETEDDKFGAGAAVFADVGIPVFFRRNEFKIRIRPAVFVPLFYAEPGVTYSNRPSSEGGNDGVRLEVKYNMDIYSVISLDGIENGVLSFNGWDIPRKNLGYDISLGVEYPLYPWLDLGANIVNLPVPFAGARLYHYIHLEDSAYIDTSYIDIADMANGGDFPKDAYHYPEGIDPQYLYRSGGVKIYRPFAMLFYAAYRPFDSQVVTFIPSLGFSVNFLYPKPGAVEGGISARLDLANIFAVTLGINYNDRKWKNSADFVLINLRAVEVDFGLSMQSPGFRKSWQGAGFGLNAGVKIGW